MVSSALIGWIVSPPPQLSVHFVDVGQGDCILIQTPAGQSILIDAGDRDQGPKVVQYLQNQGIEKIDLMVATHPHADHIGGLIDVLNSFPVDLVLMPNATHTTKTFRDFQDAMIRDGIPTITARYGKGLELEGLEALCVAPVSEQYRNLNLYSAVIHMQYRHIAFLFTGDAERESEEEMLEIAAPIESQVLKVGHHGSRTSTSMDFAGEVNPKFAVIMCGEGNRYGHPHPETLETLRSLDAAIFRADQIGTIVMNTFGWGIRMRFPDRYPQWSSLQCTLSSLTPVVMQSRAILHHLSLFGFRLLYGTIDEKIWVPNHFFLEDKEGAD
jgi:beta-lactamase superfamily II metal-dependent hydrolase